MQHQLDLWPAAPKTKAPYQQGPWESLSTEEQLRIIQRVAQLIAKTVRPQSSDQNKEEEHEQ